jgi:hypothetical protein
MDTNRLTDAEIEDVIGLCATGQSNCVKSEWFARALRELQALRKVAEAARKVDDALSHTHPATSAVGLVVLSMHFRDALAAWEEDIP